MFERSFGNTGRDVSFLGDGNFVSVLEEALPPEETRQVTERMERSRIISGNCENPGDAVHDNRGRKFTRIVGSSPALESALALVERVAPTPSTVLVLGETGTGKEVIARAIHSLSDRYDRPFITLNCAAIPHDLLESELFGHERGAFTGAIAQKIGRFEMADKGTMFLDEIGDIPLALQPKLLRVLQEQEFERLGSGRTRHVDVRLVAATNRDLAKMVAEGQFRSDLYYRLNVFPIVLPPLRERCEDISALVEHFVDIFSRRMGKQIGNIPSETMAAFRAHSWPGNVRELQNLVERAVIMANDGVLANPFAAAPASREVATAAVSTKLRDHERACIEQTLEEVGWVIGGMKGAAARLGLRRTTLIHKMKKLQIERPARRAALWSCPNEPKPSVQIRSSSEPPSAAFFGAGGHQRYSGYDTAPVTE